MINPFTNEPLLLSKDNKYSYKKCNSRKISHYSTKYGGPTISIYHKEFLIYVSHNLMRVFNYEKKYVESYSGDDIFRCHIENNDDLIEVYEKYNVFERSQNLQSFK